MKQLRNILGFIVGAMLIASSAAHSLLGWRQLRADLSKAQLPAELILGLEIGWHFAGAAMFAFGCIVIFLFINKIKEQTISLRPAFIIALVYLAFGSWALAVSKFNPFFLIFIIPGLLLLAAAW
jgi:hypothetical protein